ncbi:C39 family peptidase [Peribacillus deserti]|uniref:C39 family peptidase n=1 Tax=Peribacillus deserti TaxID=673318 RepID=UPI0035B53849
MKMITALLACFIISGCSNLPEQFSGDKIDAGSQEKPGLKKEINKVPAPVKKAIQKEKVPASKMLDVPLFNQMDAPRLYNGCEVTSLAMLMNFRGIHVSKNDLAGAIKRVPLTFDNGQKGNPNAGFVGNMEDGPGLGVYHGPITDLARKYAGNKVKDLTGKPFEELLKEVGSGSPVWIITTANFAPVSDFIEWNTPQGVIQVTYKEHSVVITGYDQQNIYVNDPYGHKNRKLPKESFIKAWEQMGKQGVTITG